MRPFLKWAGGKYRLRHQIKEYLPAGKRLIEPFAGSASIFLNTEYKNYLLADQNPDLISIYQYLQKEGDTFIQDCKTFFVAKNNQKKKFYEMRDLFNQTKDKRLKSMLFLYLNRHGYNGLCRYNTEGNFNVPYGRYDKIYFPEKEMQFFYQKAQYAEFICEDFLQTLKRAKKNDVVYCDPPYVALSKTSNFTSYCSKNFDLKQQQQLAIHARKLANKNVSIVISNHDTEFTRQIYLDAKIISFPVRRFVSCVGNARKQVQELLAVFSCI